MMVYVQNFQVYKALTHSVFTSVLIFLCPIFFLVDKTNSPGEASLTFVRVCGTPKVKYIVWLKIHTKVGLLKLKTMPKQFLNKSRKTKKMYRK